MGIHAILLARPGLQHPQPGVHVSMYGKLYVHTFFLPNHQYRTYIALSYNQLPSPSSPVTRYFYICVCQSGESQDVTNFLVEKKNTRRKMIQTCSHYSQGNWPNYLNARTWIYRVGRHGKEMGRGLHDKQHISTFTACAWLCVVTSQPTLSLAVVSVLCFCVALLVLRVKPTRWWVIKFSTSGSTAWIKAQFGPEAPLLEWTSKLLQAQLGWTEREN